MLSIFLNNRSCSFRLANSIKHKHYFNSFSVVETRGDEAQNQLNDIVKTVSELNRSQKAAVMADPFGVSRCIAGPGSGKTRVLTCRVLVLLGVVKDPPRAIMALTFTNKAGEEMRKRLTTLLDEKIVQQITVGTFHSVSARILRTVGRDYLKALTNSDTVDSNFVIYDQTDCANIIKRLMKKYGECDRDWRESSVLAAMKSIKQELIMNMHLSSSSQKSAMRKFAWNVLGEYEDELYSNNALDFDDLLLLCWKLMREYPAALEILKSRYQHVLVDEYQDTNTPQYEMIKLLSDTSTSPSSLSDRGHMDSEERGIDRNKKNRSLFVVGDINQAIYGWRGAVPENINRLQDTFPAMVTYELKENYRSDPPITAVANALLRKTVTTSIHSNPTVAARAASGGQFEPVRIVETKDGNNQAAFIIDRIKKLKLADVAILYRTNAQSREIEVSRGQGSPVASQPDTISRGTRECTLYMHLLIYRPSVFPLRRL